MVDYYRCGVCGHVWTIDKPHPDERKVGPAESTPIFGTRK